MTRIIFVFIGLLTFLQSADAQYFGRNKPRYRSFDFKVKETPNFKIHTYLDNEDHINRLATLSEKWFDYHQQIMGDTFSFKNPIIFYNNHAEFQQTNAISGNIGVGTGGVTEAFKNRVVMPVTLSNQQTDQVLGHELVHAFQFNNILYGDSTSIQNLSNLPLWIVEGMAEYMTLGRVDPFTSMWMRDALLNDNVPSIRKLANPRYFPYRYGQAMWAYITGVYGDNIIRPFFHTTAVYGLGVAIDSILNTNPETLGNTWKSAMETHYGQYMADRNENPQGKLLFSKKNSGRINVSPSVSPNGRYVIFLSEKDLFSTDLYLADVRRGKILNKVTSLVKDSDLDNISAIESAGTWSPNGKDFAFVGFKKGKNVLVIKDADTGKDVMKRNIPGINSFANPVWHPNGREIIISGLVDGQPDLFSYDIRSKQVKQLTNDPYSEILPSFNDEGSLLAFSYDRRSVDEGRSFGHITYDIAIMDMATLTIEELDIFHGSDNLNPSFDHEGNIYFISENDGFRNMYKYILDDGSVKQVTDILTGISGISRYSPMITVSTKRDKILYTHYYDSGYSIYEASSKSLLDIDISDPQKINLDAGTLPFSKPENVRMTVQTNINGADVWEEVSIAEFQDTKYKPNFRLDYIGGGTGVGVSNNTIGSATGLQGGVDMLFSDMLGNNQIFSSLAVNGDILDVGGQVAYLNRKNRVAWGLGLSHIPIQTGFQEGFFLDTIDTNLGRVEALRSELNIIRIFDENISLFAHYPFSTTLRLEGGVGVAYRSFRYDLYKNYYQTDGINLFFLGQERERIPVSDEIIFNQYFTLVKGWGSNVNVALVGDNSFFGLTSPLAGYRFRIGAEQYLGTDDFTSFTVDIRKYFLVKPFSFAFRTTNYIRFEQEVNSIYPFFVGNMGFVRGYGSVFSQSIPQELGIGFDDLIGTKLSMFSAEVRVPMLGPRQLALINSNALFVDFQIFVDAGVAFNEFSNFTEEGVKRPYLARSAGFGFRVNVFGALILEPYWAWQLQTGGTRTFGLNFIPGW